jgi:hypothetical protein
LFSGDTTLTIQVYDAAITLITILPVAIGHDVLEVMRLLFYLNKFYL